MAEKAVRDPAQGGELLLGAGQTLGHLLALEVADEFKGLAGMGRPLRDDDDVALGHGQGTAGATPSTAGQGATPQSSPGAYLAMKFGHHGPWTTMAS